MRLRLSCALLVLTISFFLARTSTAAETRATVGTVTILDPGHPLHTFIPSRALGAGVDGHERGDIDRIYTSQNIAAMRSVGLRSISYRLRTELGVESWHWNPRGAWSDAMRGSGYWISDAAAQEPITTCNGYRLPRRGNSIDQTNNEGYSRLDDGDPSSFWKSNPYLDRAFTHDDNAMHPQWVLIDLGRNRQIDAIRLLWSAPFATDYRVQYWRGEEADTVNGLLHGQWKPFPGGEITAGRGGNVTLRLAARPISTRFVRLWMLSSSETGPGASTDIRDRLGYAIREVYLGTMDATGRMRDLLRHGKRRDLQTTIYVSSTDPWHTPLDRDPDVEQPGFDRVFHSGLTSGLPVLAPVSLLYDTPENAVAELRWLRARGYPVRQIELGEEPDGQNMAPEDYGALYVQWARALHGVDPTLQLGGPGFQTDIGGWRAWPDRQGDTSWMRRFLRYLRTHGQLADFGFFSFEWYPVASVCAPTAAQLASANGLLESGMHRLEAEGVSHAVPWIITEYGYCALVGRPEAEMAGALINADIVGLFLTRGGNATYIYGYEPDSLVKGARDCETWGNLTLMLAGPNGRPGARLATYYGAWLLANQWVQKGSDRPHGIYEARLDARVLSPARAVRRRSPRATPRPGAPLPVSAEASAGMRRSVAAYVVRRPDSTWAMMLINKNPRRSYVVALLHAPDRRGTAVPLSGRADLFQYSAKEYRWHARGERGYPDPDLPPAHSVMPETRGHLVTLPPYSLSVVRIPCEPRRPEAD